MRVTNASDDYNKVIVDATPRLTPSPLSLPRDQFRFRQSDNSRARWTQAPGGKLHLVDILSQPELAGLITRSFRYYTWWNMRLVSKAIKSLVTSLIWVAGWSGTAADAGAPLFPPLFLRAQLENLDVCCNADTAGQRSLLESLSLFPELRALMLHGLSVQGEGVGALVALHAPSTVVALQLAYCQVDGMQLQRLMCAPFAARLHHLDLQGNPDITGQSIAAVAHTCKELQRLDLGLSLNQDNTDQCLAALGDGDLFELQSLSLYGCAINVEGAMQLASANWSGLTELDLREADVTAPAMAQLVTAKWCSTLVELFYSITRQIDDAGCQELFKGHFGSVERILIQGLSSDCVVRLGRTAAFPALQRLDISLSAVDDAGAAALAAAPWKLRTLSLVDCGISDEALVALAGGNLAKLVKLFLDRNPITADGVLCFGAAASGMFPRIEYVSLDLTNVVDVAAAEKGLKLMLRTSPG